MKAAAHETTMHPPGYRSRARLSKCWSIAVALASTCPSVSAQSILFDFDNAPLYTPLPMNLLVGGITARFTATGQGYSVQSANTLGIVPAGFAGNCLFPSSVFAADLMVSFSQPVTQFSILYSPQELGCDDSATMRVTAYLDGVYVGTNTATAAHPGTWPTGTLSCTFAQGFDSVVVHYAQRPPTCEDWGPIFLADNMRVTPAVVCYANCDGSTTVPMLNINDFVCFQIRFASGDSYANCDGSTAAPALNVNDFICYQSRFAAGCE